MLFVDRASDLIMLMDGDRKRSNCTIRRWTLRGHSFVIVDFWAAQSGRETSNQPTVTDTGCPFWPSSFALHVQSVVATYYLGSDFRLVIDV